MIIPCLFEIRLFGIILFIYLSILILLRVLSLSLEMILIISSILRAVYEFYY